MLPLTEILLADRPEFTSARTTAAQATRYAGGKPRPPVVVWNVCNHCNMSCPHCYASAGARPSLRDLSTQEAKTLIDQFVALKIPALIFSGGEPLMRSDVCDLIAYASGKGLSCSLSTNGVLIDAKMANALAEMAVAYVGVSIDGPAHFNDGYRGLENAHERALVGLRNAQAAGMKTGVRMTVTRRNAEYLPDIYDLCLREGFDRFYLSHLVYAGRGKKIMSDDLTREAARESLRAMIEREFGRVARNAAPGKLRVVTGGNDSDGPFLLLWLAQYASPELLAAARNLLELRGGNSAGEGMINIDHRGQVYPDQFWNGESLGDVRLESLASILENPRIEELRTRETRLTGRCGECRFVSMCRGSHRERSVAAHGSLWHEDPACLLLADELRPTQSANDSQ